MVGYPIYRRQWWNSARIRHRHLVIFVELLVVILEAVLLASCNSKNADYLVEIKYTAFANPAANNTVGIINPAAYNVLNSYASSSDLHVRIGYFGLCTNSSYSIPNVVIQQLGENAPNSTAPMGWVCSTNLTKLTSEFSYPTQDPLNLTYLADKLRRSTFSPWLIIISCILSGFSAIFLMLINSSASHAFPLTAACTTLAFAFGVVGVTWQQVSVIAVINMTRALSSTSVDAHAGTAAMGLGWSSAVFLFMCTVGLVVIYLNEQTMEHDGSEMDPRLSQSMASIPPPMMTPPPPPMMQQQPPMPGNMSNIITQKVEEALSGRPMPGYFHTP